MIEEHHKSQRQTGLHRRNHQQEQSKGLPVQVSVMPGEGDHVDEHALKHHFGGQKNDDEASSCDKPDESEGEQDRADDQILDDPAP